MGIRRVVAGLLSCVVLPACAAVSGPAHSVPEKLPVAYTAAAGDPVASFRFGHLVAGDALNERQLLVRVWPSRIWLLTVEDDCNLARATSNFHVTSALKKIAVNRDRVLFTSIDRHGACRIRQIRPVDLREVAVVSPDGI